MVSRADRVAVLKWNMPENAIVPGARPRPSRRALTISGCVGALVGLLAAVMVHTVQGGDLWLYLELILAGAFVGLTIWSWAPVLSGS